MLVKVQLKNKTVNEAEYVRRVITFGEYQRNSRIHGLLQINLEATYEDKMVMDNRIGVSDIIPIMPHSTCSSSIHSFSDRSSQVNANESCISIVYC
jgi:hypothetical protein